MTFFSRAERHYSRDIKTPTLRVNENKTDLVVPLIGINLQEEVSKLHKQVEALEQRHAATKTEITRLQFALASIEVAKNAKEAALDTINKSLEMSIEIELDQLELKIEEPAK